MFSACRKRSECRQSEIQFQGVFFFLAKIESQSLALSLNVKEQIIGIVNWIVQTFSMFSMAHEQLLWKNSVVFAFGCSAGK